MCASHSLENVAPMMELLKEMDRHGTRVPLTMAQVGKCKVLLKDNSGAIEMAKVCASVILEPSISMSSCIIFNHIHVKSGAIAGHAVKSEDQSVGHLMKPLNCNVLKTVATRNGMASCHNQITT